MKKNLFAIVMLCAGTVALNACKLTIINDTNKIVQIHDNTNDDLVDDLVIKPNSSQVVGKNPDARADFKMEAIDKLINRPTSYTAKQIACSQSHEIKLRVSDIEKGSIDSSLFTIKKGKS